MIAVVEKRIPSIKSHLVSTYDQQVERNTKALSSIIDALQFTITQGIAQRGHHWNKDTKRENGNFRMLVDLIANYSLELNAHLLNSAKMHVTCPPRFKMSSSQFGNLVRQSIVKECNESLFWSVMADETTDVSTIEQVSICVRYVRVRDEELEVCEEFLGFASVLSTTAEVIT